MTDLVTRRKLIDIYRRARNKLDEIENESNRQKYTIHDKYINIYDYTLEPFRKEISKIDTHINYYDAIAFDHFYFGIDNTGPVYMLKAYNNPCIGDKILLSPENKKFLHYVMKTGLMTFTVVEIIDDDESDILFYDESYDTEN